MQDLEAEGLRLEILIRYKCKKCGGSGARRHQGSGKVIGNCSECEGNGKKQEWVSIGVAYREYFASRGIKPDPFYKDLEEVK